jgi:hypothetical protein
MGSERGQIPHCHRLPPAPPRHEQALSPYRQLNHTWFGTLQVSLSAGWVTGQSAHIHVLSWQAQLLVA